MKAGLIQMSLKGETGWSPERLRLSMLRAHEELVLDASRQGVQVLCFQELFNQPYFCAVEDDKWRAAAEPVPDGHTVAFVRDLARRHRMVIVAPIYEIDGGRYYNTAAVVDVDGRYLGKYRKNHIPDMPVGRETYYFEPSDLGYPVFETTHCKLGVYICYDRHFPEGVARSRAQRRGVCRQSLRYAGGPEPLFVAGRAASGGRGQRDLRWDDQPRRHRGAVELRQVLRLQLCC
jgi:beta-ureidopropionase